MIEIPYMRPTATVGRTLTFNDDGTIDPAQLEGLPQEFVDQVTSEQGRAFVREQIARQKQVADFRRMAQGIRDRAQDEHEARRPSGISGRQRKRLRRFVRSIAKSRDGRLHLETNPSARGEK